MREEIFRAYYRQATIDISDIEKREFGVGKEKKIETRHIAFPSHFEFREYLINNVPYYVSHSISYYNFPSARPVQKKEWVKADLVFDLDAPAKTKYSAFEILDEIKKDTIRLVEILISDFDISEKYIKIVFSGSKGYHIHVTDPEYQKLYGEARRQITDYIGGKGFSLDQHVYFEGKKLIGPKLGEGGYRGKLAKLVFDNANKLVPDPDFFKSGIKEGNWSKTKSPLKKLYDKISELTKSLYVGSVETDVMVTQDLSRLIRVPNSLHGDTGFIAKVVSDLDKFDPLKDAILTSDNRFKIKFIEDVPELDQLNCGPFYKGEIKRLELHLALLFTSKNSAEFA